MADIELLLEAERRGILPPDKAELLGEARRRGLIPGGTVPSSAPPSMLARPDAGGENVGDVGDTTPPSRWESYKKALATPLPPGTTSPHMTTPPSSVGALASDVATMLPMVVGGPATIGMSTLRGAASRIGLGAIGGAAGEAVQGGDIASGTAMGAGSALAGEVLAPFIGAVVRGLPYMKGKIADMDAQKVLDWIKQYTGYSAPKGKASQALYNVTREGEGGLKRFLQDKFDEAVTKIDTALQGGTYSGTRPSPAPVGSKRTQLTSTITETPTVYNSNAMTFQPGEPVTRNVKLGARTEGIPSLQSPGYDPITGQSSGLHIPSIDPNRAVTFKEATKRLAELRQQGYGTHLDPTGRTMAGFDPRREADTLAAEIRTQLERVNPALAREWADVNTTYARGSELLRQVDPQASFRYEPSGIQFNTPVVQKRLGENMAGAAERMKGAEQPLIQALGRGAPPGTVDRLTSGAGGPFDQVAQVLRGQNLGASRAFQLPVNIALPNLGSQYAGRAPYTPDDALKIIMNILASQPARRAADTR